MNPFYSHSHNHHHLATMSQFTSSNTSPPVLNTIPHHFAQQNQQNSQNVISPHQFSTQTQQVVQTSPNSTNTPSSALVNAAAQFYARSSQDQFNRRLQTVGSSITPSNATSPTAPWKTNCFMENFKFETNPSLFSGIEDTLFARAEALADISKASHHHMQQAAAVAAAKQQDNLYIAAAAAVTNHPTTLTNHHLHQINRHPAFENPSNENERASSLYHHQQGNSLVDSNANPFYNAFYASHHHHHSNLNSPSSHQISQHASAAIAAAAAAAASIHHNEIDIDPRELETFAEKFKQRRIKLGVTQADVGQQLSKLKLPGVGSLSQSTICRFESLTLSHNNMIALKPVLHSWLEQAEADARNKKKNEDTMSGSSATNSNLSSASSLMSSLSSANNLTTNTNSVNNNIGVSNHHSNHLQSRDLASDRKRKRTSIAAPEKRSLEAYFSVQPRPSGEKIAQIAEKLDLKKNVVRVWFCNQRQKQKRMKFAAIQGR